MSEVNPPVGRTGKIKPSLSKGTRDFLPAEVAKRNYIFDTIKTVFRKYGFEQIETPAIERLETLTGKYGEEGDKLLFKILESGDFLGKVRKNEELVKRLSRIQNLLYDVLTGLASTIRYDKIYQESKSIERLSKVFRRTYKREIFNWDLYLEPNDTAEVTSYFDNNIGTIIDSLHRVLGRQEVLDEKSLKHYLRIFRDTVIVERILPRVLDYIDYKEIVYDVTEKGLRYDLTVPLARYVVQHQDDLAFPFKRFHIGPVWRADRPQKGRYQEFYQCDADVIGSNSLLNEVELTKIYVEVFEKLGVEVTVYVNSRKILKAIAEKFDIGEDAAQFFSAIDTYDKLGMQGVLGDLDRKGIIANESDKQKEFVSFFETYTTTLQQSNSWEEIKEHLKTFLPQTESGGEDIFEVCKYFQPKDVALNPFLARGLDYYTGVIWEVVLDYRANYNITMGSLGGGGRYDNLTEMFGGQNMSGVGISFGIERIYDVMEELNLFPETISQGVKVLFVPFNDKDEEKFVLYQTFAFEQVQKLRAENVSAEIFLGNVKKQKQFNYAEQKNISYLVEVGDNEIRSQKFRLRNAKTRDTQNDLSIQNIIEILNKG
ncbi:MAG: histidine--tRNA ligase [Bacteroidota bacterium]